jgi:hypothetical protein
MNRIVRRFTEHITTSNPCFKQASQLCLAGSDRCPNRKKVSLDTPVREFVDKEFRFADSKVGAITLRQLATHTSGLPRLPDDLMDSDKADPLNPCAHYDRAMLAAH